MDIDTLQWALVHTEYKLIVSRLGPEHLSEQVNEHLRKGWALHGNPTIAMSAGAGTVYAQAVTIWKTIP